MPPSAACHSRAPLAAESNCAAVPLIVAADGVRADLCSRAVQRLSSVHGQAVDGEGLGQRQNSCGHGGAAGVNQTARRSPCAASASARSVRAPSHPCQSKPRRRGCSNAARSKLGERLFCRVGWNDGVAAVAQGARERELQALFILDHVIVFG